MKTAFVPLSKEQLEKVKDCAYVLHGMELQKFGRKDWVVMYKHVTKLTTGIKGS